MAYKRDYVNPFDRPIVFYDMEVFVEDWMICFIYPDGRRQHFHNSGLMKILQIINTHTLVGFNNYHYDDKILTKIAGGKTKGLPKPTDVKEWNDDIILRKQNWYTDFSIYSLDCYKQLPMDSGLKTLEARNGAMIKESDIDFTIDRKLEPWEVDEVIEYCYYDVEWTKNVYEARADYWNLKEFLYEQTKEERPRSFTWNTTSATKALFSGFEPLEEKIYPREDLWAKLPDEVRYMFENDTMEKVYVETKTAYYDFSDGGGHGVNKPEYGNVFHDVLLWDVNSLYPTIMKNYNMFGVLTDILVGWLEYRLELKQAGNTLEKTYKLLINSLYGLTGDTFDDEEKKQGIKSDKLRKSVCLIGQACLYDLGIRLEAAGCRLVNINTDGVAFVNPDNNEIAHIKEQWEKDWNMGLSEEIYDKFIQKDVNNYIGIEPSGKMKLKGADVKKANLCTSDNFIMDNTNYMVIDKALVEYFVNDKSPMDTFEEVFNERGLLPFAKVFSVTRNFKDAYAKDADGNITEKLQHVNRAVAIKGAGSSFVKVKDVDQYFGPSLDEEAKEQAPDKSTLFDEKWRDVVKAHKKETREETLERYKSMGFETQTIERNVTVSEVSDNMLLVNDELSTYDLTFEELDMNFYMELFQTRVQRWV